MTVDKKLPLAGLVRLVVIAVAMGMLAWLAVMNRWEHPLLVGENLPLAWVRGLFFAPVTIFVISEDLGPAWIRDPIATWTTGHPRLTIVAVGLLCGWIWYQFAKLIRRGW